MVSVSLSLEPPASGFKLLTALADGLMLVFQHPAEPEGGVNFLMEVFERMNQKEALVWIADIFEEPLEKITPETRRWTPLFRQPDGWDKL
jgi:hypothetical protein